ncbi:MAG: hypothetical protein IPI73_12480 [Betaproteobacteria bacterium]|nr:hypothetical protein [Betaproteobacteria bacterium]
MIKLSIPARDGLELPAIILPPALLTDEHSTLIVPPGMLATDEELQLGAGGDSDIAIVTRLVEQTLSFERYEFIPVE